MSPVPLALGLMVQEEGWRGLLAEGVVGALGVVEDEPVGELAVEEGKICQEQIHVIVDEGLLDGADEALGLGVHL